MNGSIIEANIGGQGQGWLPISLYTLYRNFKIIPFTLFTYVLARILQNGAKFIQKPTPGLKNHMRNLDNYRQAVESPKSWNFVQNCIPSATTYTEDLFDITFNFLHENSPNDLCHFWNHMSFFTTQPLYISNWKFSDLSLLSLKFTKFLMSFLEPRVSVLQTLHYSSVSWD